MVPQVQVGCVYQFLRPLLSHPACLAQVTEVDAEAFQVMISYLTSDVAKLDSRMEQTFAVMELAQKYQVPFFIAILLTHGTD